jgi:hypothetical protein
MIETSDKDAYLAIKLVPQSRTESFCFVSSYDKPFLLSKVAGTFTVHNCHILEAEITIREGIVTDFYRIWTPKRRSPAELEEKLYETLRKVLRGETNIDTEIYLWEKANGVIQDEIDPKFKSVSSDRSVLTIHTSNKRGLLHKISWALSLAGVNIEKAIISAAEGQRGENVFWIRQRQGEEITPECQQKILDLLRIIVNEGKDPIEQAFKKEIYMIYRQQLRRGGSGFRTAQLYAQVHLRLIHDLFDRFQLELNMEDHPLLIGVYGGIGSGAIGFTSDIDCLFLYDGEYREEYDKLKTNLKREFKRICDLDVDESFLPYHINFFFLGKYDGEAIVSFEDFLNYIIYIDELRRETDQRFFEPQFFHFPWAFSIRFIGKPEVLARFKELKKQRLPKSRKRGYTSVKAYVLGEKRHATQKDYIAYLRGKFFPKELTFMNMESLKDAYRRRDYGLFIESIYPYDAIKYLFRRGVFPLLHLLHGNGHRTDMGLLRREYRHIKPALDFMLKAFNVRKTLFIMGQWDLSYFLYIMNANNVRAFCKTYLDYQRQIIEFVQDLIRKEEEKMGRDEGRETSDK